VILKSFKIIITKFVAQIVQNAVKRFVYVKVVWLKDSIILFCLWFGMETILILYIWEDYIFRTSSIVKTMEELLKFKRKLKRIVVFEL